MTLGTIIRKAREEKKLTQTELGIKIGVSKYEISRYENDSRVPRAKKIRTLAESLGINIEDLLESLIEIDDLIKWGRVYGRPREFVYIPMYQNRINSDDVSYTLESLGAVVAAGANLSKGQYIWVANVEGCRWIKRGTRLLVYKTSKVCKGDLAAFLLCDDWIWVGEVTELNGELHLCFIFNGEEEFLNIERVRLLGKIVHLALDL
ncbi:MAG: HTH-type transcriptional repressor RghR [Pelotomaculum sp. PtaB.Bin013]|uniref:Helix-turn-helix domain-containing protein n=1 Tax=Pelotomaculum isophthalicicum JI TaxID=947010 RepID=A0A9X4H342_9FIRM|nr:helix-turn-helix transcriptional regulator [Pelotomaculum isophthalicicum]MDF9407743.1 helix-turn-helix domain-containing protein [Pelotomaculum isophthalicicum JI]OPX90754.1 MAG: HTH-type transcriptional repressor RghR [Pelotomaculum sp. PtaB.Bin013]